MNPEQRLQILVNALYVMKSMPESAILENKKLVGEIKEIVSSPNFRAILNDISGDLQMRKLARPEAATPMYEDLLKPYVKFQDHAFSMLERGAPVKITEIFKANEIRAHNSKARYLPQVANPFTRPDIAQSDAAKEFERAFNSIYSDRALQINTPRDPTFIESYIDYSPYIVNYKHYLSIPTLSQSIKRPIAMATDTLPKVEFEDKALSKTINLYLKRHKIKQKLEKLLFYSALSPRGAIIVPIEEDGKIRFNVFNDTQFTYASQQQYNRIDFRSTDTGVGQLFCLGHLLENEVSAYFLCPDFDPIFAIGQNKVAQLKTAAEAVNIYLYTIKVLCIRAQIMVEKWGGEGQTDSQLDAMLRQVRHINSELSLSTLVQVPKDADFQIIPSNFSPGFSEVTPIIKQFQGSLTGLTPEFLYGSENASFSANNFNLRVSHKNIFSELQMGQIEPVLRFAINTLLTRDSEFSKYSGLEDQFDIEFESLYEPTEQEQAEIAQKKIDNITKMRDYIRDYPDLEEVFKTEELLHDEVTFQGKQGGDEDGNGIEDDKELPPRPLT